MTILDTVLLPYGTQPQSSEELIDRKMLNNVFVTLWKLSVIEDNDGDMLLQTSIAIRAIEETMRGMTSMFDVWPRTQDKDLYVDIEDLLLK